MANGLGLAPRAEKRQRVSRDVAQLNYFEWTRLYSGKSFGRGGGFMNLRVATSFTVTLHYALVAIPSNEMEGFHWTDCAISQEIHPQGLKSVDFSCSMED